MTTILYITANPKKEEDSNSLRVGRALVESIRQLDSQADIVEIDVYKQPIPLIDSHFLNARSRLAAGKSVAELQPEEQAVVRNVFQWTDQFIAADAYVFAYPLWNFGIPPMLKAYVDTIKIARKTFRYTPEGPVGLLSGKKAVLIQSSGDIYSEGPLKEFEHGSRYLKSVLWCGVHRGDSHARHGQRRRHGRSQPAEGADGSRAHRPQTVRCLSRRRRREAADV